MCIRDSRYIDIGTSPRFSQKTTQYYKKILIVVIVKEHSDKFVYLNKFFLNISKTSKYLQKKKDNSDRKRLQSKSKLNKKSKSLLCDDEAAPTL